VTIHIIELAIPCLRLSVLQLKQCRCFFVVLKSDVPELFISWFSTCVVSKSSGSSKFGIVVLYINYLEAIE
jgi:hypothetical protein